MVNDKKERRKTVKAREYLRRKRAAAGQKDISRRGFLKAVIGLGVVSAVGLPLAYIVNGKEDRWDFLREDITDYEGRVHSRKRSQDHNQISAKYVPLDAVSRATENDELLVAIINRASDQIRSKIKTEFGGRKVEVIPYVQTYGVPLPEKTRENFLDYAVEATEFFNDSIEGFDLPDINWKAIKEGDNFEGSFNGNGYLAHTSYHTLRLDAHERSNPRNMCRNILGLAIARDGGEGHINPDTNEWYIALTSGPDAITTPFSEGIPILTRKRDFEYLKREGAAERDIAVESLSEGIAYILGKRISRELNIPNGEEMVEATYGGITHSERPRYALVSKAINWFKNQGDDGPQKALEIYMDDPGKFVEEIKRN